MAKAPKAPGKNGASTLDSLVAAFADRVPTLTDGHWRGEVVSATLAPIAKWAGADRAKPLLEGLRAEPYWHARGAFSLARGLALAGHATARRALEEARVVAVDPEIQGQHGTLVWIEAARAFHALGAQDECDRALDEALACAHREQQYPTQPRPWLAVGYARTGRIERLIADLRERLPDQRLSFDDDNALRIAIERSVTEGDVALFSRLVDLFGASNGCSLAEALARSAVSAASGGHRDALVAICLDFCRVKSYASDAATRVAYALAEAGELDVARRIIEATRDACGGDGAGHARFLSMLERPFAGVIADPQAPVSVALFRIGHRVDPSAALALADAREAQDRPAAEAGDWAAIERLGTLAVALGAAGFEARADALSAFVVDASQALSNTSRSIALKSLALLATEHSLGESAFGAFKKISSKPMKAEVCKPLSLLYVRKGDFVGASMILALGESRQIWQLMRHSDAIAQAAGTERTFSNHS